MDPNEAGYLACCFDDASHIDGGVSLGLTADHFTDVHARAIWGLLGELRAVGEPTDTASFYAACVKRGCVDKVGGLAGIGRNSVYMGTAAMAGPAHLQVLLAGHSQRTAFRLLTHARGLCEHGTPDLGEVGKVCEEVIAACTGRAIHHRPLADIAGEAVLDAAAAISGEAEKGVLVTTGLPNFDRWATPIRNHEYVVVAGRSSHGKSSLMLQLAGHNLAKGLKVVIFSLETSDKAVVKQLAGQRAGIDLRNVGEAMGETQQKYVKGLEYLAQSKNLLVFDRELTIEAIQARCRLLAQSFKPDLVILDYMGLIAGADGSAYERASKTSKAMIPLQKSLGCCLMVGVQLNQGAEKEEREPTRTDFRDSGQILEDCHRAIAVWRKPGYTLDQQWYDYNVLQLKLRDGPLTTVKARFHAPSTRFVEGAA